MDKVLIKKVLDGDRENIIKLFKNNYRSGYYNKYFQNEDSLKTLLDREDFIGLGAYVEESIIGFSGIYIEKYGDFNKVYLAHFLVDEKYRNKGIGKLIEKEQEQIYENLQGLTVVYSILGLDAYPSLKIKEDFNYKFWGIRQFYGEWEPNQNGYGHLVVVGKVRNHSNEIKRFYEYSPMTQRLIKSCYEKCEFKNKNIDGKDKNLFNVQYHDNTDYGQYACSIKRMEELSANDSTISDIIDHMLVNVQYPYIALRFNISCVTKELDNYLISKEFYPTSYLPYFDLGEDVIEYQYIKICKIENMSKKQPNIYEIKNFLEKNNR